MKTAIKNGRIIDSNGERTGDVVIKNGIIIEETPANADITIDARGFAVMPAFADTHCHLRDPGFTQKETMETGMKAALKGGYATLCAMANTNPVMDTPDLILQNSAKAEKLGLCRLIQTGAAGIGLGERQAVDYAAISSVTNVISNDGKTIWSESFMENLLRASAKYGFLVSTHCDSEVEIVRRDIDLVRRVGGRLHVGHISLKETLALIKSAKSDGLTVSCEVMPHHIFDCDNPYKVNPPMATLEDVNAHIDGIIDGRVDCLATDHAPHTDEDKAKGAPGISNIEYAAAIFWKVLSGRGLTLPQFSRLMTKRPLELLCLGGGLISPNQKGDVVVFDPDAEWKISKDKMISRSHNTPFDGREVKGRIIKTIVGGKILYDYDGQAGI